MRIEFEWQEAPGVRDQVLAATWARLGLKVGDAYLSEVIDLRSESRRIGIYGSLFPLAEWLIENWWHLLHEPSPKSPIPAGRMAPRLMHGWLQRHNLLAAQDGGSLPDLTITRDGGDVLVQWDADPVLRTPKRVRFVGQGQARIHADEFERSISSFVEAVLARLGEQLSGNEDVERAARAWDAIRSAGAGEADLCRALAVIGVDPYDPEEATEALTGIVERGLQVLRGDLRADFFEGSDPQSIEKNLNWIERAAGELREATDGIRFPTIDSVPAPSAHETGYLAARQVRSDLLGLKLDDPVRDLPKVLARCLGWAPDCLKAAEADVQVDGLVGLDSAGLGLRLVVGDRRSDTTERFRLARAAFFPVTRNLGGRARLLTRAVTHSQRAARAFAAELLAPSAALAKRVSQRVVEQDIERLAAEFSVSSMVIRHQIENHALGYLET